MPEVPTFSEEYQYGNYYDDENEDEHSADEGSLSEMDEDLDSNYNYCSDCRPRNYEDSEFCPDCQRPFNEENNENNDGDEHELLSAENALLEMERTLGDLIRLQQTGSESNSNN